MAAHGVPEHWIVDPASRQIELSVLGHGRYGMPRIVAAADALSGRVAGLEIDLVELFRDLE